jgi:hypothetical protein
VADASAPPLVAPAHRPTLGDLTRSWPRRRRIAAVAAVVAAALAALIGWLLLRGDDAVRVVVEQPIAFNLRHPPEMTRRPPQGDQVLRLERRRPDGLFVDAFAVEPLALPPYRGEPSGALPAFAVTELAALERRYAAFEWVREGKTRVNEVPGYAIEFRARLGERRLYGRVVLLPEPRPGARRGARLVLLATPAAGVANAGDVGSTGAHALPYRSFRFGTEAP